MNILFVCSGNTCRSPMAEAAWRALPRTLAAGHTASSCGLMARPGAPAAEHSVRIARDWDVDLSGHRARRIKEDMVVEAGIVCAMSGEATRTLRDFYPHHRLKMRLLTEFLGDFSAQAAAPETLKLAELLGVPPAELMLPDIDDPFGGPFDEYVTASEQIRKSVLGLAEAIRGGEVAF